MTALNGVHAFDKGPLIGAAGKDMSFVLASAQTSRLPSRTVVRVLAATVALLLVAPALWLATGHLPVAPLPLNRVQVQLNFAALIDWGKDAALTDGRPCTQALGIDTIALMFLTTGPIPHERTWRLWLEGAAGWLPYQGLEAAKGAACGGAEAPWQRLRGSCGAASSQQQQHLFKLYVHALPNFTGYDPGSIFHDALIPDRVVTEWGGMSLVIAERLLLQAALRDESNTRFLLISDSGIPLYDPLTFYQQLMHENRSRVKACRVGYLSDYRWHPVMALKGLRRAQWRKSSQWFGLTREHAQLMVDDEEQFAIFQRYCHGWDERRSVECYPDEHYLPTLLSVRGRENETYCGGYGLAATDWRYGGPHPRAWRSREIKPWLLETLRSLGVSSAMKQCNNGSTQVEDAQRMFVPMQPLLEATQAEEACELVQESSRDVVTTFRRPLPGDCPLTARKFPKFTTVAVHSLMKRTCLGGNLQGNCTGIKAAALLEALPADAQGAQARPAPGR